MKYKQGPFQWAGGKNKALKDILPIIYRHDFHTFVEPFIGAANVSLNVNAEEYLWADTNPDLILSYEQIWANPWRYKELCNKLFEEGFDNYYELRDRFNTTTNRMERAVLFQYLNKHGFNGLYRCNSKGKFNVPRGTITKNPKKVPLQGIDNVFEMLSSGKVSLYEQGFEETFKQSECIDKPVLIYSDSPYTPVTSEFKYTKEGFNKEDHERLKELSKQSNHTCLISNHWTEYTQELYSDADEIHLFDVQRTISCKGAGRKKVQECLVVYN